MITAAIWFAWAGVTLMVAAIMPHGNNLIDFVNVGWGLLTISAIIVTVAVNS